MLTRILAFGLLTTGSLLAFAPSVSADTYCNGVLYDPLTGDELVTECYDYYMYSNGCYTFTYYLDEPVYLQYAQYDYCFGSSGTCYLGLVYLDTTNIRTGLC